jgi:hypothetical protein
MKTTLLVPHAIVLSGLAVGAACQAVPPSYGEATAAYKTEVKPDSNASLVNPDYLGDIAGSKAVRKGNNLAAAAEHRSNLRESERNGGGGVDFASPTINGTVRGDVTIVVQRGAVRGSITSVRR